MRFTSRRKTRRTDVDSAVATTIQPLAAARRRRSTDVDSAKVVDSATLAAITAAATADVDFAPTTIPTPNSTAIFFQIAQHTYVVESAVVENGKLIAINLAIAAADGDLYTHQLTLKSFASLGVESNPLPTYFRR